MTITFNNTILNEWRIGRLLANEVIEHFYTAGDKAVYILRGVAGTLSTLETDKDYALPAGTRIKWEGQTWELTTDTRVPSIFASGVDLHEWGYLA